VEHVGAQALGLQVGDQRGYVALERGQVDVAREGDMQVVVHVQQGNETDDQLQLALLGVRVPALDLQ